MASAPTDGSGVFLYHLRGSTELMTAGPQNLCKAESPPKVLTAKIFEPEVHRVEHMSSQNSSHKGAGRSAERVQSSTSTGRLRSACDSCHQAKTKCSGGSNCLTCQMSQIRCTYSPGNRLGRPKGSKNKRTLQQKEGKSKNSNSVEAPQWVEPEHNQQQSDLSTVDFDLERGFDAPLAESLSADSDLCHLLNPDLSSLIDDIGGNHMDAIDPEIGDNANFIHTSSAALTQPNYRPEPNYRFDMAPTSNRDSGHASSVSASSSSDYPILPSPCSTYLSADSSFCSCLPQHVQLVYQLGDLQCSQASSPSVDSVLRGVQKAQIPWESLMQCSWCQSQDNQKEVFLLFAMSIRILLSATQRLSRNSQYADTSSEAAIGRAASATSDVGVSVGSFELTGEAKAEVIGVALQRALRSITSALIHLWGRAGRPGQFPGGQLASSINLSPSADAFESSMSMFSGVTSEASKSNQHDAPLANLSAEDTHHLLDILQCTLQTIS